MTNAEIYQMIDDALNDPERTSAEKLALAEEIASLAETNIRYYEKRIRDDASGCHGLTAAERN